MKKPLKKFKAGLVTATIWENEVNKIKIPNIQVERSYLVKDEWKNTSSMRISDLPLVRAVTEAAYNHLILR